MSLTLDLAEVDNVVVVRPEGRLDLTTYRTLRDGLLKCAVTGPSAVVVRLGEDFEFATPAVMSVFSTVWMRVSEWPGVRIMLVGESDTHRHALASGGAGRFVPHFASLEEALAVVEDPPHRRRDEVELPESPASALMARQFVRATCERWEVHELADDAVLVATELVDNALRHARSAPNLRMELRGYRLVIAVRDGSNSPPTARVAAGPEAGVRGIQLVEAVSRFWGYSPWPGGGKVVWAVLDG
ncbi:hypothetical protein [Saccharothrix coeruleofusca]|uniref:STAS domain-containing protein n=1 Tax=Saccharothrix coeruleofusca TaxID=33919 RepID=A0A918EH68_9PSEU|nr:hypothetical protein [Saccharothrix coeruleofusca]MBP2335325.1 hypothetical protein [Saccharothrix coeruleofusca]GGP77132.1 hypothetical protein GCM10010185_58450 [Saccharothrix coeruleofusca]